MFRYRIILFALVAIATTGLTRAQQSDDITVATNPGAEQVRQWLRSGDPYLVSWGAYFASRNDDEGVVIIMLELAERWASNGTAPYSFLYHAPSSPRHHAHSFPFHYQLTDSDAMSEMLYALIERGEVVPPEAISAVTSSFPAQAAILAARLPPERSWPLLQKWFEDGEGISVSNFDSEDSIRRAVLARIAALLLAKNPPPGFPATLLQRSTESLIVSVVKSRSEYEQAAREFRPRGDETISHVPVCEDAPGLTPPDRFPPFFQYRLEENPKLEDKPTVELVTVGTDTIRYKRSKAEMLLSGCYSVMPLNNEDLHHLLAYMLGIDSAQMPWHPQEYLNIQWEGPEQFLFDLAEQVDVEEAKFQTTASALREKGLLTSSEAQSARPLLAITAKDWTTSSKSSLPQFVPRFSHVTYEQSAGVYNHDPTLPWPSSSNSPQQSSPISTTNSPH